ncbi:MAG: ABC transporter ATP-binding protein [Syntrophothermus sp.]|uniref:metal ABC transporter ATP-binding protein n=1 Tax=Syntrophothermus sp. TaxID=2736299 RepID=UPI00257DA0CC|nr:ABC transporter ATP-binding protein [Syntrophothermus sp.]NSW83430.1 ABC transporter ATP-binding protein [Syntrophothermus sp.]
MNNVAIELHDVHFSYGHHQILKGVDLKVYSGDFVGVIGVNGSGKSTLIKIIVGLLKPQSGLVKLLGKDLAQFHEWHRIGYLSQKASFFNPSFPATVQEIVRNHFLVQASLSRKLDQSGARAKVERALALTGLSDLRHQMVGELSGGQQQRVFLARVLVSEPEILLLDEPLVGIDAGSQELFCSSLEYFNRELGITVLMVTHNPEPVADLINRLACLEEGHLFVHDSPEEIRHELQPHRHVKQTTFLQP